MPPRLLDKASMICILHTYLKSYTARRSIHIDPHTYTHTCTHLKGSYGTRINNIPPQELQINKNPVPELLITLVKESTKNLF